MALPAETTSCIGLHGILLMTDSISGEKKPAHRGLAFVQLNSKKLELIGQTNGNDVVSAYTSSTSKVVVIQ